MSLFEAEQPVVNPCRIVSLKIENIRKITIMEIVPGDSPIIRLTGKNGAGKSSILDSIFMALGGGKIETKRPVHEGADKGVVTIDFGAFTVIATIRDQKTKSIVIKANDNVEGKRLASPQALLDSFTGSLTFDPAEFSKAKEKRQQEILRELVGLDLTALEERRDKVYKERTAVNQRIDDLKALILDANIPDNVADEEISIASLQEAYSNINNDLLSYSTTASEMENEYKNVNLDTEYRKKVIQQEEQKIVKNKAQIEDLRKQIAYLESDCQSCEAAIVGQNEIIKENQSKISEVIKRATEYKNSFNKEEKQNALVELKTQMDNIAATNDLVRRQKFISGYKVELKQKQEESKVMTTSINQIDKEKAETLAAIKYPIDGLLLDEKQGVMYKGLPFSEASTGEKLRVACAIGMAMNPTMRIMLIREGSDLDKDNIALIHEMAMQYDCQVWMESVGDTSEVAVILEEGEESCRRIS